MLRAYLVYSSKRVEPGYAEEFCERAISLVPAEIKVYFNLSEAMAGRLHGATFDASASEFSLRFLNMTFAYDDDDDLSKFSKFVERSKYESTSMTVRDERHFAEFVSPTAVRVAGGDVAGFRKMCQKLEDDLESSNDEARAPANADEIDGWVTVPSSVDMKHAHNFANVKNSAMITNAFSEPVVRYLKEKQKSLNISRSIADIDFDFGFSHEYDESTDRYDKEYFTGVPLVAFENYYDATMYSHGNNDTVVGLRALGPTKNFDFSVLSVISRLVQFPPRAPENFVRYINRVGLSDLAAAFFSGNNFEDTRFASFVKQMGITDYDNEMKPITLKICEAGWAPSRRSRKKFRLRRLIYLLEKNATRA